METSPKPDPQIAAKSLPEPLYRAIRHIFAQEISGCMLVGGTALSGFYAGHRRSDDIDLFTRDETAYKETCLAVSSLNKLGCILEEVTRSNQYYKSRAQLDGYSFTIDVVLDSTIFNVGSFHVLQDAITIADLPTLIIMKSATLLSRCSEKDIYDLVWLFENQPGYTISSMIDMGKKIDNGFTGETLLYSLTSATLDEKACSFAISPSYNTKKVYKLITTFRKELIRKLHTYLEQHTDSELAELVTFARKNLS